MIIRDLHSNKETKNVALYDLEISIKLARREKDHLLCVIVGYGSSGKTHIIKTTILNQLDEYKNKKFIKDYIIGNELDMFNLKYLNFKGKDFIPDVEKRELNSGKIYILV